MIVTWLVLCFSVNLAFAGAPRLDETCVDRDKRPVPTRYETSKRPFAAAARPPVRKSESQSPYVIYVNPDIYFLSGETQQWLYLRQCVQIQADRVVDPDNSRGINIADEEDADCLAAREMLKIKGSQRMLYSIERDIERIDERRWSQVLYGPVRRVPLAKCLSAAR